MNQIGIALISLLNTKWAKTEIANGRNSIDWSENIIHEFPQAQICNFISEDETNDGVYLEKKINNKKVKKEIYPFLVECVSVFKDCEHVIFLYTDSPLNDVQIIKELLAQHIDEMAEYSFTENYPEGIGGEILSYPILVKLKNIASGNNELFNRNSISKIIHFDVNQYDVEVLVSEKDVRKERLSLVCDSNRNYLIVQNFLNHLTDNNMDISVAHVYDLLETHPQFMRTVPAFVEIEITNDCNCRCDICPRTHLMNRAIENMSLAKYKTLIDELQAYCDEIVINLGLMGEPALHPQLFDMIEYTLSFPGLRLIIESNGILLDTEKMARLVQLNNDRLIVIIALDSPNQELYQKLRGTDEFNTVENHCSYLLEKKNRQSYIQILRLKENNDLLDVYYKRWNAFKEQIILQKYNSYKNQLQDRKGADLSPLRRFSCWHLKRDMVILVDGTVPFCKQDVNGDQAFGNVFSEGVGTIWEKITPVYVQDHQGNIDSFCQHCDEWFSYNF